MPPLTASNDGVPNSNALTATATNSGSVGVRGDGEAVGIFGASIKGEGVHAHTESDSMAALAAVNVNTNSDTAAIYGEKRGDRGHAAFLAGNVHITRNLFVEGDITLPTADFAEEFTISGGEVQPGTVMVFADDETLCPSDRPYDSRVAGIVSGAGAYAPAIILDRSLGTAPRRPIALLGKVYCKVDASFGPIAVGDLLTTSPSVGHAMKATDASSAFGAVIGKALRAFPSGQGLIPVFVTLQ